MVPARILLLCGLICSQSLLQLPFTKGAGDADKGLGRRGAGVDEIAGGRRLLDGQRPEHAQEKIMPHAQGAGVALAPGHAFAAETKDTNQFGVSYDDARVMADMLSAAFDLGYISYDVPAESTSAPAYSPSRPFKHMFPQNYNLLFIPASSFYFAGYHWAIFNETNTFYGYDDADATSGDYDYDENEELPNGCEFDDSLTSPSVRDAFKGLSSAPPAQAPGPTATDVHSALSALGSHTTAPSGNVVVVGAPADEQRAKALEVESTSKSAPIAAVTAPASFAQNGTNGRTLKGAASAPAPAEAPKNITWIAAKQAAIFIWPDKYGQDGSASHGDMAIRCRPVPARSIPSPSPKDNTNKVATYFLSATLTFNVVACTVFCVVQYCNRRNPRVAPGG